MKEKRLDFKLASLSILTGLLIGVVVSLFRLAIPLLMGVIKDFIQFVQHFLIEVTAFNN